MEQAYWIGRKRASVAMAREATSAEARLIHLDLAGRYSVKAASEGGIPPRRVAEGIVVRAKRLSAAVAPTVDDGTYYAQLEEGARFLAARAATDSERQQHLGMANRYVRLSQVALEAGKR